MVLELEKCKSFESHIKVKTWSDTIDTLIGMKRISGFTVSGFVSISLEEFKEAWKKAVELAVEDTELTAELEIEYYFEYENEIFNILDEYQIKNDRVIFKLEV
jgi:poly-beta-hydroxyalkanoate depolymerase